MVQTSPQPLLLDIFDLILADPRNRKDTAQVLLSLVSSFSFLLSSFFNFFLPSFFFSLIIPLDLSSVGGEDRVICILG